MEMKATQMLRHRGSGIPTNLPTTTPLRQGLALQTNSMDILTVRPSLLEVGSLQSHPCPLISVPLLIPGMCDMLLILHQLAGGHLQITSGVGCLRRLVLPLRLVETFFPSLIDHLLVPGTQISTGAVDCHLLDMATPQILLTCLIPGIHHHRCRIIPVSRHSHHQRWKASLQSNNSYQHSAPASLGPRTITKTQVAARRLPVPAKIPGVRWIP